MSNTTNSMARIHYLDNLRALAMLLGVYLHGVFAYAENTQTVWLATDTKSSVAIDISIWSIHLFRMGLFFAISGFFAKFLIENKGLRYFIKNRLLRIVLPFIVFYPVLVICISIVIVFALSYVPNPRGLIGLISSVTKEGATETTPESPGLTTMHLWFLYYLTFFCCIAAVLSKFQIKLSSRLQPPTWSFVFLPVLFVPGTYLAGAPIPAPESFVPELWPFLHHGLFFWLGWSLFGSESKLDRLSPYLWPLLIGCAVLFVPYYRMLPVLELSSLIENPPESTWLVRMTQAFLSAYLSLGLILAATLFGKRYLSTPSRRLRLISDSSYWVYLVHLPVVVFLQTLMIPYDWNVWLKAGITVSVAWLFCFATYLVFVRYTPIGWLLNGKRSFST